MSTKRKRRIIAWSIIGGILAVILIFVAVCGIRWSIHKKSPDNFGSYQFDGGNTQFDLDLFPSLVVDKDADELKIMQIADPQIKFGSFTRDTKTMDLLDRAIKAEQPDICVVTGDLTLSVFTYDAFRYFANFMEEREQYWTFTFGNHDSQFDCSKYTICTILQEFDYCLFDCGPSDVYGASNFLVNIFKGEKRAENLIYSLVLLDSGMYPEAENVPLSDWVYDWIKQSQMNWYEWAVQGLRECKADIQTSMFFHIPLKEFANMYYLNEYENKGNNNVPDFVKNVLHGTVKISDVKGVVRESDKKESECVYGDDGYTVGIFYQGNAEGVTDHPDVFKYIKELGCTKALFVGHDHVNNLKGYYDGIYLGYGLCCGYHTYPFFNNPKIFTGKVLYNSNLWTDDEGNKMEKGVTVIQIALDDSGYGALIVNDRGSSFYK
ncbi:MAG: metallophosphoesterase [Clostridiales bacterium]|nr:metallophosphoesterase [Clostridiales bacterium]